jgi:hypothetical protein
LNKNIITLLTASLFAATVFISTVAQAAVLPEDRTDIMYHSYDGGGVTIDGPSVLVRKDFKGKVSVSANYYVDNVSSASIDVESSGASRYAEERTEYSVTADYLYDKTIISGGVTTSTENDYEAETTYIAISQDFFGDLTTLSLSYARGNDVVMQNGNDAFEDTVDRQNYRFGISQIATKNLLVALNFETITEEGYLNNPYRSYRFLDPINPANYVTEREVYPRTHTSDAASISASYFLPYRAALKGEYRYFTDDWDIEANTYQLSYTHPLGQNWILDIHYRSHDQTSAYFYSDLFEFQSADEKDFRARDKELSDLTSTTIGLGVSYEHKLDSNIFDRAAISLQYDMISFDYENFTDLTADAEIGEEPLYVLDADVIRFFISIWY